MQKKSIILSCIAVLLIVLLVGCKTPAEPSQATAAVPLEGAESADSSHEDRTDIADNEDINTALSKLPEAKALATTQGPLFAVIEFGTSQDMPWGKINAIENLDRGTYDDSLVYYFLVVPKYNHSSIAVYATEFKKAEEEYELERVETLYQKEDTPDDYGLIVNSSLPETSSDIEVTLSYEGQEVSYHFHYDGKGDRPAVQFLPEDNK